MATAQWIGLGIGWTLATLYTYYRARTPERLQSAERTSTYYENGLSFVKDILARTFGSRYWTRRGLGTTFILYWSFVVMYLALEPRPLLVDDAYASIAVLVAGIAALLPFWLHTLLHSTRIFLEFSERYKFNPAVSTALVPVVPVATVVLTTLPVAVLTGMVDAESIVPRNVTIAWISIVEMVFGTWWPPTAPGDFPLILIPLGIPAIALWLFLVSYWTWKLHLVAHRALGWNTRTLTIHQLALVCLYNVILVLCLIFALFSNAT